MNNMTKEYYDKLEAAAKTLCKYCENDECEKCQVSVLMNDAYAEKVEYENMTIPETQYEVVLVIDGYLKPGFDDMGNVTCNGLVECEDGNGNITNHLKDGRLPIFVNATDAQDAYDKAILLLDSIDMGDIVVEDWNLEHVYGEVDDRYWYKEDLKTC